MMKLQEKKLDEVFWFQEGPGVRNWQFSDHGVKLLNVANILKSGEIDLSKTDRHLTTEEVESRYSHFLIDKGDLVIASSGISIDDDGFLRTRGAFIEDHHLPLCMNTSTIRFKNLEGVSSLGFLKHWLQSFEFRSQISREVTGIAQKNFGPSHLKRLTISLPPLAEQKRIAAILDAADALRAKRRETLAQLNTLLQSTFLDMFGDPVTNPKGWELQPLEESVFVQGGFAFKSRDYCESGIRLVKISNVHSDNLTWDETDYVPAEYLQRYKNFALEAGDLVIALTRPIIKSLNSVKIATIGTEDAPSLLNQRVARFIFSPNSTIKKAYLLAFCRTQYFKNAVQRFCSESLQPNMSTKQLGGILIAQPSLPLQHRFATIVESIEKQKTRLRAHLSELDTLFASLQSRAFNGEL